jgi:3-deoxy-manno-octulosonate cytidylyltransferase (CMP-KDO synthetase)
MGVKSIAVIPARLSSTRMNEKLLADLSGMTVIQRVFERAKMLKNIDDVIVATDSEKIAQRIEEAGGRYCLTPADIRTGSDRVFYAVKEFLGDVQIIVNIQGDEPFFDVEFVDYMITQAQADSVGLYSAYYPVSREDAGSTAAVKVVIDSQGHALYFSRNPVPFGAETYYKHIGVYIWKRWLLEKFYVLPASPLELSEKLEQLRVLENGYKIKMFESPADSVGIDTQEDLEKARRVFDGN